MRTTFYQGARTFTTGEAATPKPGPDEALLRVRRVGICGTDLHIFQGHLDHRVPKGGIIGHETFGEIVDVVAWADRWTDGTGVDVAFEVTGSPAAARAVADVVRVWGTVSIVAIHA